MEIKYVVFAVVAVLAQTFIGSSSAASVTADSTANSTIDGTKIMSLNEGSSLQNAVAALGVIFERINKLTVEQIFNDTASSNYNASATIDPALLRIKDSVDFTLNNTLPTAGKTSCDAVDGARSNNSLALDRIWANITEAIEFVESTNSTNSGGNTNGIAKAVSRKLTAYQTKVRSDFEDIVQNIVLTVTTCAEITSIDELEVIRIYHDRMDLALHRVVNSVFNAIRYYAYTCASGTTDWRTVQGVDQEKTKASAALLHNVESAFSMMEAIYVYASLNKSDDISFPELAEVVYTRKYAGYRFKGAADALISRIDGYLFEETLSFAQAGEEDFSLDDNVQASVAHLWRSGTQQILSSFEYESSSASTNFPDELATIISEISANFAHQLHLAKTAPKDSDTVPQIDDLNAKAAVWAVKYVNAIYKAMLNGNTLSTSDQTSIQTIKKTTVNQMKIFMDSMSKAYKILAQVISKSKTMADVNDSLNNQKSQVYSAVNEIIQSITNARIIIVSSS